MPLVGVSEKVLKCICKLWRMAPDSALCASLSWPLPLTSGVLIQLPYFNATGQSHIPLASWLTASSKLSLTHLPGSFPTTWPATISDSKLWPGDLDSAQAVCWLTASLSPDPALGQSANSLATGICPAFPLIHIRARHTSISRGGSEPRREREGRRKAVRKGKVWYMFKDSPPKFIQSVNIWVPSVGVRHVLD